MRAVPLRNSKSEKRWKRKSRPGDYQLLAVFVSTSLNGNLAQLTGGFVVAFDNKAWFVVMSNRAACPVIILRWRSRIYCGFSLSTSATPSVSLRHIPLVNASCISIKC